MKWVALFVLRALLTGAAATVVGAHELKEEPNWPPPGTPKGAVLAHPFVWGLLLVGGLAFTFVYFFLIRAGGAGSETLHELGLPEALVKSAVFDRLP